MYPLTNPVRTKIPIITIAFLIIFLFLIKTIIPKPAFVISPANVDPNDKLPLINKSVIITLDAQLGINPIIVAYIGVKNLLFCRMDSIVSSPT